MHWDDNQVAGAFLLQGNVTATLAVDDPTGSFECADEFVGT